MAGDSKRVGRESGTVSSLLQFEQNPRRRMLVLATVALFVVAALALVAGSLISSSGCNAVLPASRFGCIATLAGQTGNSAICNRIGNLGIRNSCIISVAESSGNVLSCQAFDQGQYRTNCVENVSYYKSDPSLCDGLDSGNQSVCRYGVAAKLNFSVLTYCTAITEPRYRSLCDSQSYYHLALSTGNYSYCGALPAVQNATVLYAMGQQDSNYQSSSTGLLSGFLNTTPRDLCYSSLSASGSHGSCAYVSNLTLRAACNSTASPSNSTFSVANITADCAGASTQQVRDLCYFGVYSNEALQTYNESWCGMITNSSYMASCVVNLATSTGNSIYCGALQDPGVRQSCISETRLAVGNYT